MASESDCEMIMFISFLSFACNCLSSRLVFQIRVLFNFDYRPRPTRNSPPQAPPVSPPSGKCSAQWGPAATLLSAQPRISGPVRAPTRE